MFLCLVQVSHLSMHDTVELHYLSDQFSLIMSNNESRIGRNGLLSCMIFDRVNYFNNIEERLTYRQQLMR